MPTSRRSFIQLVGLNGLAAAAGACAPGSPSAVAATTPAVARASDAGAVLRLDSNENSSGPGPRVLAAIQEAFGEINRYPFATSHQLVDAIAPSVGVSSDQVELGCGSSEILDASVTAFTAPDRALVTAVPTFEMPAELARHLGHPVVTVPVTDRLTLDLGRMAERAAGAGLYYVCNPNNPTGTLQAERRSSSSSPTSFAGNREQPS